MHVVSALLGVLHLFTTLWSSHHISLGLLALAQGTQQAHRLVRVSVTVRVSIGLGLGLGSAMQRKPACLQGPVLLRDTKPKPNPNPNSYLEGPVLLRDDLRAEALVRVRVAVRLGSGLGLGLIRV